MHDLFEGYKYFKKHIFPNYRELYENLAQQQKPHTLFITCSDSRIVPHLYTSSSPGELFVIQNVAGMVPPYQSDNSDSSTIAGIEYAVKVLQVKSIVICGHSNCGGCKAMYSGTTAETAPYTHKWLEMCQSVKNRVKSDSEKPYEGSFARRVEQENVILQIEHLRSYPFIRSAEEHSSLQIYGWYCDIGKGIMYNYNQSSETFERIK